MMKQNRPSPTLRFKRVLLFRGIVLITNKIILIHISIIL